MNDVMRKYGDIIGHDYQGITTRKPMTLESRAAQFAPFAALTGHGEAISEAARLTSRRPELSDTELELLSRRMSFLMTRAYSIPAVTLTYFRPDPLKDGGSYHTVTSTIRKYDEYLRTLSLADGLTISMDNLISLESEIFDRLNE